MRMTSPSLSLATAASAAGPTTSVDHATFLPLAKAIGRKVAWSTDVVGPAADAAVAKLKDGEVILMENVRFHPEEEKNDPAFAKQLAALGDLYVNDAFSAAH